jgi:peptidoglycan/xylan/chitin deacetylase (PgdA/CDA1 family)
VKRFKPTALRLAGFAAAAMVFARRLHNKITVLMYHGVRPDRCMFHSWMLVAESAFDRQLRYLSRHFDLVSLDHAIAGLRNYSGGRPKVVITFDDGMKNNVEYALPILERYNAPVTFYVSTEAMITRRLFWWDRVNAYVQKASLSRIRLSQFGLGDYEFDMRRDPQTFWRLMSKLLEDIKRLPGRLQSEAVNSIQEQTGGISSEEERLFEPIEIEDIKRLAFTPLIQIASHGHRHQLLPEVQLKEAKQCVQESVEQLQQICLRPIEHFSYPNGNYNEAIIGILKDLGFVSAVTTASRRWTPGTDPYQIPRIGIGGYDNIDVFRMKLSLPERMMALFKS